MTNHREVISAAISEAQRDLAMWGWDAAVRPMLDAGVKVDLHPIDRGRFPRLDPYRVELTTRLWDGTAEEPQEAHVIGGGAYGLSISSAFVGAMDDLALSLNQAQRIVTDEEVWS